MCIRLCLELHFCNGKIVKNSLQNLKRETRHLPARHIGNENAARDVGQRRTRRLQFPLAASVNPAGGNWRFSTLISTFPCAEVILSLPPSSKHLFANH